MGYVALHSVCSEVFGILPEDFEWSSKSLFPTWADVMNPRCWRRLVSLKIRCAGSKYLNNIQSDFEIASESKSV